MIDKQLTKDFSLDLLTHSDTATRNAIHEQFLPTEEVQGNLKKLAENILQPLRDGMPKDFFVTCAYRCAKVNQAVGGALSSQHLTGQAADLVYIEGNLLLAKKVLELDLPFDQMILEGGTMNKPNWIHVSYSDKNRRQILRADFTTGKAVYSILSKEQIQSV